MTIKRIPIRNFEVDYEKRYLEEKYKEGLRLKKCGMLMYQFERVEAKKVSIEIDFIDYESEKMQSDDWMELTSKKTKFSKKTKVYYISNKPEARLLIDDSELLRFYKYYHQFFLTLINITLLPFLLTIALLIASFSIPMIVLFLSFLLLLLCIYFTRLDGVCYRYIKKVSNEKGLLTGEEAQYILTFKQLSKIQEVGVEKQLSQLGYIKKISATSYRIKPPLGKKELLEEMVEFIGIAKDDINLVHIGDLYLMA